MPTLTLCVDECGLLALDHDRTNKSSWRFISSPLPPPTLTTTAKRRNDPARTELEDNAAEEFVADGGQPSRSAEARAWLAVYTRRRLTCIVRGARSALEGTAVPEEDDTRASSRKKDAPDHSDRARVRLFMAAQAEQHRLSKARSGARRTRTLVAAADAPLAGGARVWEAPASSTGFEYRLHPGAAQPHASRTRCVVDGLASACECRHALGASLLGMDGLSDVEDPGYNGESTLVASPPEALRPSLGEGGVRIVRLLLWRIAAAVRTHFGEARPLFRYEYSVSHVDRANVASYDYSAVLYLNTQGEGFAGGEFRFVDAAADEVVQPRVGRCVLFASGFEHLHQVCAVTKGSRYALAAWLTLTESAADGPLERAEYTLHEPVPPPSAADEEADQVRLEDLKERLMAAGGCSG